MSNLWLPIAGKLLKISESYSAPEKGPVDSDSNAFYNNSALSRRLLRFLSLTLDTGEESLGISTIIICCFSFFFGSV